MVPSSSDYNVFINSHEPDVCFFARHLHNSLVSRGLRFFPDSIELKVGQSIPSQIKDAIKGASLIITIFSPNYTQSQRCLHELLLALLCKSTISEKAYNYHLLHISVVILTTARVSLLRQIPLNIVIATLRNCVANKASLLRRMPPNVAIATLRHCDVWKHLSQRCLGE